MKRFKVTIRCTTDNTVRSEFIWDNSEADIRANLEYILCKDEQVESIKKA